MRALIGVLSLFLLIAPQAAQATMYAPGATLDPACAPTDANCGVQSNTAVGTLGQVPYYSASGNILAATSTFQILTNGTASTTSLVVSNSFTLANLSGFLKATAGAIATSLINLASDVTGILPVANGGTGVSAIQSGFIPFGNGTGAIATSSAFFFDSINGRLGIGTTSPYSRLSVWGEGTGATSMFELTNSASTSLMTVLNSGNVGIGTTSPSRLLTVGTNNQFTVDSSGDLIAQTMAIGNTAPSSIVVTGNGAPSPNGTYNYAGQYNGKNFYKSANWYMWFFSAGANQWMISVAPGTSSSGFWYISSAASTPPISSSWLPYSGYAGNPITSTGNAGNNLTIDGAGNVMADGSLGVAGTKSYFLGNVGVSTPTPAFNLDVNGITRSGDYYIGAPTSAPTLVYVGDSLTVGQNGTHSYNYYITPPTYNGISYTSYNIGVGARTVQTMAADAYINLNPLYSQQSGSNIAVIWGGTNDIFFGASVSTTFSYLQQFAQHERQLGFKVIVLTMISRTGLDPQHDAYNALIRANWPLFADGLADVAANPNLGADGAYANSTYFGSDGTHLTDAGYILVGSIVQTALTNLISGSVNALPGVGNVGIGTTSPFALLSVSNSRTTAANTPLFAIASTTNGTATTTVFSIASTGDVTINGSSGSTCTIGNGVGATSCTSDERLKTNIALIIDPLKSIEQLRGVTFNWKDPTKNQQQFIGVIAQDVQKVFPQAVVTNADGYLAVDYAVLVAPLIEAVKELAGKVSGFAQSITTAVLNATTVNVKSLCLTDSSGSTCYTRSQLNSLLNQGGQQSNFVTNDTNTSPITITDVPPADTSTTTTDSTATTTNDTQATTTPDTASTTPAE